MERPPSAQGLYHPSHEHDACGMGFVVNLNGEKSHDIIRKGIDILINLTHRGACGCDPETGDGAGILIQIPHEFFARECAKLGFRSARSGPLRRGHDVPSGGTETTPVVRRHRRANRPRGRPESFGMARHAALRRCHRPPGARDAALYRTDVRPRERRRESLTRTNSSANYTSVRRRAEVEIAASDMHEKDFFYVPSLSSRIIVYKGLLLAPQICGFLQGAGGPADQELAVPWCTSAFRPIPFRPGNWRILTA